MADLVASDPLASCCPCDQFLHVYSAYPDYGKVDLSAWLNVLGKDAGPLGPQGIRPAAAAKKGEPARGMINEAEKWWPGVKAYLNATGRGSEPKLIRQLVARAERRPGHQSEMGRYRRMAGKTAA